MKVKAIEFRDGQSGVVPGEITAVLSLEEAYVIAKVFGSFSDLEFTKRNLPRVDLYNDLNGDVFNRYWDDGVDGARADAFV